MFYVLITVYLSSVVCFFAGKTSAQSYSDTTKLQEIEIVENRLQTKLSASSQNIQVISSNQIKQSVARSLNEVLAFVPGVDVRQRGPFGGQADISLRGGTFEQTLLLVNGIKLTDPQTGHHTMNVPIPLLAIDHIEVLKGAAARVYGQNAFTGAVNIITQQNEQREARVQLVAGDYKMKAAQVYVSLPYRKLRQSVSAAYGRSDSYWHNSDFVNGNALYEATLKLNSRADLKVLGAYLKKDMGANGYYSNRYPDQWESTETGLLSVSLNQQYSKLKLQWRAYYRGNNDEFRLKRYEPKFYTNVHHSDVSAFELNGRFDSNFGQTGFGVDTRRETIESTNLGLRQRDIIGLFAEQRVRLRLKWDLRAGLYANYYSQYGLKFFPGAEAGFQITKHARLYSNGGYSYRIPTYTELYYTDPTTTANPNLKPEQAISLELGYRCLKAGFRLEANTFFRHTNQLIDYYRPDDGSSINIEKWSPRNVSSADFSGIECQASHDFAIKDSVFTLQRLSLSYNFLRSSMAINPGIQTRYALDHYRHQTIFQVQVLLVRRLTLNLQVRYLQRLVAKQYLITDVKLNYEALKPLAVFAEVSNLGNTNYIEAGYVQMPGRWLRIGMNLNLKNN